MQKTWEIIEILANGQSSESNRQELSNEYQHGSLGFNYGSPNCLLSCALDESGLSIGRVNRTPHMVLHDHGNNPWPPTFKRWINPLTLMVVVANLANTK